MNLDVYHGRKATTTTTEPPQRDGSNDGSQHVRKEKREIWKIIPKLSILPNRDSGWRRGCSAVK